MNTTSIDYNISSVDIKILNVLKDFGSVKIYRALWKEQLVCVKEIQNDCYKKKSTNVDNELRILSKSIHPKIVQFLGAEKKENKTTIVFEYMERGDLDEYIEKDGLNLDDDTKLKLMLDITLGLHYLHLRCPNAIIHRDLKPANILINKYGCAKICDFGLSKLLDKALLRRIKHSGEKGTYIWMAPEVLKHEHYDSSSDIYSLGLIIYFIWTSKIPFHSYEMNIIQIAFAKHNNALTIEKTHNKFIDDLINKCISFEPKMRPKTIDIIRSIKQLFLEDKICI
tara:strand:- start:3794 stop:4639 length:846 start_codon:yes stop_codon:yes gene_type:complete